MTLPSTASPCRVSKTSRSGAGIDVVEVHGVAGADGQGVSASVGKEGGVCPGVVCGRDLVNLA